MTDPRTPPRGEALRAAVRALVERFDGPAPDDDTPRALSSLVVVQLAEALEDELALRLRAADVVRANFESVSALAALAEARAADAAATRGGPR